MSDDAVFPIRRFEVGGQGALPDHWYDDNLVLTHMANGIGALFPAGERFFIRSVLAFVDQIDDPEIRAQVRAFAAQEAQHGAAHDAMIDLVEGQGFELESWLRWYHRVGYEEIEHRTPKVLRLATTVALEHLTATLAQEALGTGLLDGAHPIAADLLRWHAVEEIEHKAVAFEVLSAVDPRWSVRAGGMAIALLVLFGFWHSAARHLLVQDKAFTWRRFARDSRRALRRRRATQAVAQAVAHFLRPGFHPDQVDNRGLARDWISAEAWRLREQGRLVA